MQPAAELHESIERLIRHRPTINGVLEMKLPLLPIRSQYRAKRRSCCIVAKSMQLILQNFVGRVWAVNHRPLLVVPDDRRAAQTLEDADLDFLRPKRDQPIESRAEALHCFTRQTDDQIRMNVHARLFRAENESCLRAGRNPAGG